MQRLLQWQGGRLVLLRRARLVVSLLPGRRGRLFTKCFLDVLLQGLFLLLVLLLVLYLLLLLVLLGLHILRRGAFADVRLQRVC